MKKIILSVCFLLMSGIIYAQAQKVDTARVDSAQREVIYKMPMDTTHQSPEGKKTDPKKARKPKSNISEKDSLRKE